MTNKQIYQTFWSKPCVDNKEKIRIYLYIAALSLGYAHKSGYKVKMYTDSYLFPILNKFGYDEINIYLDEIPEDINAKTFFAYPKFFAGLKEPLGAIHTDFDVILKKPCIDEWFTGKYDCILQGIELFSLYGSDYANLRKRFNELGNPVVKGKIYATNVGIIGFTRTKIKNAYYKLYFDYVDYYKDKTEKLAGLNSELIPEQCGITQIVNEFDSKVFYMIPPMELNQVAAVNKIADEKGYCHLQGNCKDKVKIQERIKNKLKEEFPELYDIVTSVEL